MSSLSVKDVLYNWINNAPESRIQQEIAGKNYAKIIEQILDDCLPKISDVQGDNHEVFGAFAESMLHYLLTNALIPSQRKITIKDIELDVIIPDSRTLLTSPKDSLVLHFVKTSKQDAVDDYLTELQKIQPIKENIWIISEYAFNASFKTYQIKNKASLGKILDDINGFISTRPQTKFRIFKT